jgi:hypothetical protein
MVQITSKKGKRGIVIQPGVQEIVLPLTGKERGPYTRDLSHLFDNPRDVSRTQDLADYLVGNQGVQAVYLGGGTVNSWLFAGQRGHDTDLLAVIKEDESQWSLLKKLIKIASAKDPFGRTVQMGNYAYHVQDPIHKMYMNLSSPVSRIFLKPIPTLEERRDLIIPRTIDLILTAERVFKKFYG